jgi:sugar-phosphatase
MDKTTYIFDMDGVLIDSEPFWVKVEQQVFAQVGVELTEQMCATTTGLRCMDVVQHWYNSIGWSGRTLQQVHDDIIEGMLQCFRHEAEAMPGAKALIERLAQNPDNTVAICSGSSMVLIEALIEKMGIGACITVAHSAQDDEFGKPHPMPYLKCAQKLGKLPSECVVFEDSVNGAISGKAAGMYVVAIPDGSYSQDKFAFCDEVIERLTEFKG